MTETQIIVERLDVHHGGKQMPSFAKQIQIPAQVLVTIALMAQCLPHTLTNLPHNIGHGIGRRYF